MPIGEDLIFLYSQNVRNLLDSLTYTNKDMREVEKKIQDFHDEMKVKIDDVVHNVEDLSNTTITVESNANLAKGVMALKEITEHYKSKLEEMKLSRLQILEKTKPMIENLVKEKRKLKKAYDETVDYYKDCAESFEDSEFIIDNDNDLYNVQKTFEKHVEFIKKTEFELNTLFKELHLYGVTAINAEGAFDEFDWLQSADQYQVYIEEITEENKSNAGRGVEICELFVQTPNESDEPATPYIVTEVDDQHDNDRAESNN